MPASAHDEQALELPPELIRYIRALSEPIEKYSPYFDALLIKRRNHAEFFQDLKDFRCQEHVIALLTSPTPDQDIKQLYRDCSNLYLDSRFAHPWCRSTVGKEGWGRAEWGRIKKETDRKRKEEERLHRSLVPIWCGFRVRMMPMEEVMKKFLEREKEEMLEVKSKRVELGSHERTAQVIDSTDSASPENSEDDASLRQVKTDRRQSAVNSALCFNAEAYVAEEEDAFVYSQHPNTDEAGASAAAKLFVGIAATSFLAKSPRARKYLMKKLNKK